jgi:hypothetical protein
VVVAKKNNPQERAQMLIFKGGDVGKAATLKKQACMLVF